MAISFKPSESVQSGIFAAEPTAVTVTEAKFVETVYEDKASVAAKITVENADGETFSPFAYNVGSSERFIIIDDGNRIDENPEYSANDDTKRGTVHINRSSAFHKLNESLINAGVPEDVLTDNLADWVGLAAVVQQFSTGKKNAKGFDKTVLHFVKADPATYGGNRKSTPATAKAKVKSASATATSSANGPDLTNSEEVANYIIGTLLAEGTSLKTGKNFSSLKQSVFRSLNGIKGITQNVKVEVLGLVTSEEYIGALDGYVYEDGELTRL